MMRHIYIIVLLACLNIGESQAQSLDHRLGQVIVEVSHDKDINALKSVITGTYGAKSAIKSRKLKSADQHLWIIEVDHSTVNEDHFLRDIIRSKYVLTAQRNKLIQYRKIPNDPLLLDQWQYINDADGSMDLDIDDAWDHTTGGVTANGDTIVVAVIDSGVQYDHEDLIGNMWVNHGEIPNNEIDDDGNGYVDDYLGYSAYSDSDNINSSTYHGTEVTGIIAAKGNNGIGVSGINWDVKVMFIQGGGDEADALEAYAYPYAMRKKYNETGGAEGAFVVATNSSWGIDRGDPANSPLWCDFYNKMGEEGIISCGATANANNDVDTQGDLPTGCSSNYLISVTNLNRQDLKEDGSGFGKKTIDLGAYGEGTYTIKSNTRYGEFGGTSGATPHVTGTIALLYSVTCKSLIDLAKNNPSKAALAVKDYILNGVVDNPALSGITTTGGKLNINKAVENAIKNCGDGCTDAYSVLFDSISYDDQEITFEKETSTSTINIRYRKTGSTNWIVKTDISSPYSLSEWDLCSEYEVQLGTDCSGSVKYYYSRYMSSGGCCEAPVVTSESFVNDHIVLAWNLNELHSFFQIQYRLEESTTWESMMINGTSNSYTIPLTLESCQYLEYRIKSNCELVDNESSYSDIKRAYSDCGSCLSDYCVYELDNSGEYISKVSIDGIFESNTEQEDEGYSYNSDHEIILRDLTEYTFNLDLIYGSTPYDENCVVFIDMNYDGIFQNSEKVVDVEKIRNTTTQVFTIPALSNFGNTRMRVAMMFDNIGGGCQSSDQRFGEVEDYCIEIVSSLSCPSTVSIDPEDGGYNETEGKYVVDTKGNSTTIINVKSNGVADQYVVSIKRDGEDTFKDYYSTTPAVTVDIEKCLEYDIKAYAQCSDDKIITTEIFRLKTLCGSNTSDLDPGAVKLYPSPGHSLRIETELDLDFIEILNIEGKSLGIYEVVSDVTVASKNLSAGIYMIRFRSNDKNGIKKWVKL